MDTSQNISERLGRLRDSHPYIRRVQHRRRLLPTLLFLLEVKQDLKTVMTTSKMSIPEFDEIHTDARSSSRLAGEGIDQSSLEMKHLRQKYEALLKGAPDAVFVANSASGKITDANQAAASLLETTVDDIIGRHQSELHPPEELDKYRALFERHKEAAQGGRATFNTLDDGSQIYAVTDHGRRVPVEISASFVDFEDRSLFVGIFRDITDRRRREQALKAAREEAEQASRLKSAMLANMSHEIRTPITSIIGFSKVLTQMLEGEPEEHAQKIYWAGQHLMKTVNSVLELSKLEAGIQTLRRRPVRLGRVAEWAVELLGPQAEQKGLALELQVPDEPVSPLGSEEALNRIAENLLENAIKFTPEGGRVAIRVRQEGRDGVLEVEDTGIGMELEEVSSLFQAFKQGSEGFDREYEGVGLGLSIVQELTNALGGEAEVETEKGEGSCFSIRLPLGEEEGK